MPQKMQRRERSGLPQLAALLTLLVALVVSQSGCRHRGPKVEICLPDGNELTPTLDCYSQKTGLSRSLDANEAVNYICLDPNDYERFLTACQKRRPAIVDTCLIDNSFNKIELVCSSSAVLSWTQSIGFICSSPDDFEHVLKWCLR